MDCPLETRENADRLLDYCNGTLDAEGAAILKRHIADCPACARFAANQQAVWQALDGWEAPPVSSDFDRRLYARIEGDVSWWQKLVRPFRPATLRWNVAASTAGVFVVLAAGLLLNRPPSAPRIPHETAQVEGVQPDLVEHALDAMDTLSEFSTNVKDSAGAKM